MSSVLAPLPDPPQLPVADAASPGTPLTSPLTSPLTPHESARERLLGQALRLFAAQGFARTSVREIAEAAQVNVASIRYYFGDKAGLYRAVFFEPLDSLAGRPARGQEPSAGEAAHAHAAHLGSGSGPGPGPVRAEVQALGGEPPLADLLRALFDGLLAPLRQGERARLCMQLHFREMVEPTGLWDEEIEREIRPMHEALVAALRRHFRLAHADPELVRLALMIAGLGVHLHVSSEVIERLAPDLRVDAGSVAGWTERLLQAALALVAAESVRRGLPADAAPQPPLPPVAKPGRAP